MSKRILILTGSPRRGGNSDLMADAFAKGASEAGNSVVQFNTAHKHIQGCRACDNCFSKENKACIFNDDFNELASLMAESDVIVFCTPLYWYSFPTQIKAAIDKFYSFIIGKKDVPIKECMLLSCGDPGGDMFCFDPQMMVSVKGGNSSKSNGFRKNLKRKRLG